ncbi:MAG: prepilin-type N-terminal cleavage/methylation domain-containing protein [Candidatus Omnitrophota bacterium]|jgi:prepilin-type N-terminal cleavage/methylation domain-containing protein
MRAFTLIETLVSLLIFTVIAMGIFLVVSVAQRSWFTGDTAVEVRQQIIIALITINRELSETASAQTNLTAATPKSSITFRIPHDNNGDGSVVDVSGNIEWSDPITYSCDASGNLTRTYEGVTSIMAHDISSLQFTNTQSRLIQVDITAQKTDDTGKLTQDVEQAVIKMRN